MNVLSLRINAVRSDDNVKKISQELLHIEIEDFWPEGLLLHKVKLDFGFHLWTFVIEIKRHFTAINNAPKTEYQLREIKSIISRISRENSAEQNEKIARKFVSIYFTERTKHPVKSSIQRYVLVSGLGVGSALHRNLQSCLFSGFNQSSEGDLLVACIEKEIQRRISSISAETSHHFISCLNEASQNFNAAIKVTRGCLFWWQVKTLAWH